LSFITAERSDLQIVAGQRKGYELLNFSKCDHQGFVLVFAALALLKMDTNGFHCNGHDSVVQFRLRELVHQFQATIATERIVDSPNS
jgi:hypothetical protein